MSARSLLVLVFVLAGCTGAPGSVDSTPMDSQKTDAATSTASPTPEPDSRTGLAEDGYANAFTFEATAVTTDDITRDLAPRITDLDVEERRVARAALANGSTVVPRIFDADFDAVEYGPLTDGQFLRNDGVYYRVNASVVGRQTGAGYSVDLEGPLRAAHHEDYETATTEAVARSNLSRAERALFSYGAPPDTRRENSVLAASYEYLSHGNRSLNGSTWLDGGRHYVRDDSDLFRLEIDSDARPETVRFRVRYHRTPVATAADGVAAERFPGLVTNVTESVPPEPARSVLLSAIENGSHHWSRNVSTRPERIEAASEWVLSLDDSGHNRAVYVRYEGTLYRIVVSELVE